MNNRFFFVIAVAAVLATLNSCKLIGGKDSKKGSSMPSDGQLRGAPGQNNWGMGRPPGMIYVPPGTFVMGASDADINFSFTTRTRMSSMSGFWMDATEITNNEYRQFTNWVRDSIAAKLMGLVKQGANGNEYIDWKKAQTIKWGDEKTIEKIDAMIHIPENRINGEKEIDASKLKYKSEIFDYAAAAQNRNPSIPRSAFIIKKEVPIYPDSLCWKRDFTYGYNEPMMRKYFVHSSFGNYPVVGVSWVQATAFCEWRTQFLTSYLKSKKKALESDFRLPTEAEWEYAARGGKNDANYPWGIPYTRNKKGCLLANFKPGRGNYPEDGGLYTVRADAYWPNDYGLYNMAGNVAEWTASLYNGNSYTFQHDLNPDMRYNAKDSDPPRMKMKVVRGGSWKDVGYFLQTSTRNYEYQDTSKSYIGFRCVIDLPASYNKKRN